MSSSESKVLADDYLLEAAVTLVLQDGEHIQCSEHILTSKSRYFAALLQSGMAETQSRTIRLDHLDPTAMHCALDFLRTSEVVLWSNFQGWQSQDGACLEEVFDYLQLYDNSEGDDLTLWSIGILRNPMSIAHQCVSQGWVDENHGSIIKMPTGKRQRAWRFWVCYLLCFEVFPEADERMHQLEFTEKLGKVEGSGGAITLRRELVEYKLIQREGDGSAYWRPTYTVAMVRQWLHGIPRRVI